MIKNLLRTILVVVAPVMPATAQETIIPAVDPAIEQVWSGGYWQQGGREGSYRMIVSGYGFEHRVNKLQIEWIEQTVDQPAKPKITRISVSELNDIPWYVFSVPKCIKPPQCTSFEILATHTYELSKQVFSLVPQSVGRYVLEKR